MRFCSGSAVCPESLASMQFCSSYFALCCDGPSWQAGAFFLSMSLVPSTDGRLSRHCRSISLLPDRPRGFSRGRDWWAPGRILRLAGLSARSSKSCSSESRREYTASTDQSWVTSVAVDRLPRSRTIDGSVPEVLRRVGKSLGIFKMRGHA